MKDTLSNSFRSFPRLACRYGGRDVRMYSFFVCSHEEVERRARSRAEVDPRARTFFRPPPMRVLRSVALLWSVCEWSVATYVQPTQQPGRHLQQQQQQQQQQQRRRQQQRRSLPVVCSESTKKKVRVAPWQAAACTPLTCSALCTSDRLTPVTRSGCGHGTGHLHLSGPRCH